MKKANYLLANAMKIQRRLFTCNAVFKNHALCSYYFIPMSKLHATYSYTRKMANSI